MRVLLIGGTGQVGSHVTQELLAQGIAPRVLTRSEEKAAGLPAGAEAVIGDLDQPQSLQPALEGIEAALLLVANDPREMHWTLTALAAIQESTVRRLVYLSNHLSLSAPQVPHAGAKQPVEAAIKQSGLAYTILQPTFFMQNDVMVQAALTQAGLYPFPIGPLGTPRVDTRDVAAAATAALLGRAESNASYILSSPDAPNGAETAALWQAALGREVHYPGDDLVAWAENVKGIMPDWFIGDLVLMFRHLQTDETPLSEPELALQEELLGRPPRRYDAYIREMAEAWRT